MKIYAPLVLATMFIAGCGSNESSRSTNSQPTAATQPAPSRTESPQPAVPQTTSVAPVEFTYGGITADKANAAYKIKVNSDKPIEEVHLALKETDASGKVTQTTIVWQNIVGSTRHPIERGKTYEDKAALDPAAAKAECSLSEVAFKDGTRWSAR